MVTVIDTTVENGFCCGCGVCAGVCPSHNLVMEWNHFGEYNPIRLHDCKVECGVCIAVCPFSDGNVTSSPFGDILYKNIPGISYSPETGYYLGVSAGAVTDQEHRLHSASGGLATWFLNQLLVKGIVDSVICVTPSGDENSVFHFTFSKTANDLWNSAGSVYYPVEASNVVSYMLHHKGRYAVIGLPCLLRGLRLAQKKFPVLQYRIPVFVGLACASLKNRFFTEYAAYLSGNTGLIRSVSYRKKSLQKNISQFQFQFQFSDGSSSSLVWDRHIWQMYHNGFCTLSCCNICDDVFAECADVCFMDAWIPSCAQEPRGTSIWLSRTQLAEKILQEGVHSGNLMEFPVSISEMIAGQSAVRWKKDLLEYRLKLLKMQGKHLPYSNENSVTVRFSYFDREQCKLSVNIQSRCRDLIWNGNKEMVYSWFSHAWRDCPLLFRIERLCREILKHIINNIFMRI